MTAREDMYFPPLPVPLVLDRHDAALLDHASERIVALLTDEVERLIPAEPMVLRELRIPGRLLPFMRDRLDNAVTFARCDFLLSSEGWQLVEVNIGGACGGLDIGDYNDLARAHPLIGDFVQEHNLRAHSPLVALADRVLAACRRVTDADPPTLAVVDSPGFDDIYRIAHQRVARQYAQRGLQTVICNESELELCGHRLYLGGVPIHAVHREFILEDMMEDADAAVPVFDAALHGTIVLVSGFREEALGGKAMLAFLRGAAARGALDPKDRQMIQAIVPDTRLLHRPQDPDLAPFADPTDTGIAGGDWVLKPSIGSSGGSVVLGPKVGAHVFREAVATAAKSGDAWICQRFVKSRLLPIPSLHDNGLRIEGHQIHPSIFVLDGKAVGAWTRAVMGDGPRLIGLADGALYGGVFAPAS